MPQYTELDIVSGCKKNKRVFQEALYKKYYSLFMNVCMRYAMCVEDAEQLLQDGFLKIFNHIQHYKGVGSFEGWMRRIMVNNCLDYLRSKDTRNKMNTAHQDIAENNTLSIEAHVLQAMEYKELLNIIHTLPVTTKTVLNLYVFEGMPHKEIAQLLQISEGTSCWHMHQARKLLQEKITLHKTGKVVYEHK